MNTQKQTVPDIHNVQFRKKETSWARFEPRSSDYGVTVLNYLPMKKYGN